ncbi:MAG: hypothetical protein AAF502_16115 [Bacteroidota bacterium]
MKGQINDFTFSKLQNEFSKALGSLNQLKDKVKIRIGSNLNEEVILENNRLIPTNTELQDYIRAVHWAQRKINDQSSDTFSQKDSLFLTMRNLIMVLLEIRNEIEKYQFGLMDIRKIFLEELDLLQAISHKEGNLEEKHTKRFTICKNTLARIEQPLSDFEEKLNILEAMKNY